MHGDIIECREGNGEVRVRAKDEKGEWEGYCPADRGMNVPREKGKYVRTYGKIVAQPDGGMKVASQWIKEIEEREWGYCVEESQKEWIRLLEKHPELDTIRPFVLERVAPKMGMEKKSPIKEEDAEFVAASEFTVERHFV